MIQVSVESATTRAATNILDNGKMHSIIAFIAQKCNIWLTVFDLIAFSQIVFQLV